MNLVSLPSELPVSRHDHCEEDNQTESAYEEPAKVILDSHFALFAFRRGLHFCLLSQNF